MKSKKNILDDEDFEIRYTNIPKQKFLEELYKELLEKKHK